MKPMFANLTTADFRGRSQRERRAAERNRVHTLFDVIQVAIHAHDARTPRTLAISPIGLESRRGLCSISRGDCVRSFYVTHKCV